MFFNIYDARLEGVFSPRLLVFLEAGILIWFLANYALFAAVEPDRRARGAYIQNAFRSNIAVVGVSLAQSMMGDGPGGGDHLPVFLSDHAVLDLRTEAAGLDVILFLERKSIKKSFIAPLKLLRFQGFSPVSILYF